MRVASESTVRRRSRKPERGVLHRVLLAHIETFVERARAPDSAPGLPRFVERELRRHLECGLLAHGFARVHCSRCLRDELVAFSCKGRGFCPSCCGRRMADTAANLVDHVLPHAPARQWVLSFPFRIRFLLASSPRMCAAVRGVFTRTLLGWLEEHALAAAAEGSARSRSSDSEPAALLTYADVAELVEQLARRITRYLERHGRLPRAHSPADAEEPVEHDTALFDQLCAASCQVAHERSQPRDSCPIVARIGSMPATMCSRLRPMMRYCGRASIAIAVAPATPARKSRLNRPSPATAPPPRASSPRHTAPALLGQLCASLDGFSLQATVALEAPVPPGASDCAAISRAWGDRRPRPLTAPTASAMC